MNHVKNDSIRQFRDAPKPSTHRQRKTAWRPAAGNVASRPQPFSRSRMRRELVVWLVQERCSHALTLATNRSLTVTQLTDMFRSFCLDLDRACLGKRNVQKVPVTERLFAIAFVEHPDTNIHLHAALRLDGWWRGKSPLEAAVVIDRLWKSITAGAGSTRLESIADGGWGWYMTKQASVKDGQYLLASDYHPDR